jgi:cholesterol oxidase
MSHMMDADAIIIGSGFGGAITGCRLAQAGYKVLILERGREWTYEEKKANSYPRLNSNPDVWEWSHFHPELLNGWMDLRVFSNMTVAQGAGVGGGSLIYANVSVPAPRSSFVDGWPADLTYDVMQPYYERVATFMEVEPLPDAQFNGRTRLMKEAAGKFGASERFSLVPLAIKFDKNVTFDPANPILKPSPDTLKKNQHGVLQGTCYHCGLCDVGCDVNARNTLDTNYIPAAVNTHNAVVRPLHLVTNIEPIAGGYRVYYDRLENQQRVPGNSTARIVIVAAGSIGSTELLLRCRDETGTLPKLSPLLGHNWSSNGDFLTPAYYANRQIYPMRGPTISSVIDFLDGSVEGQSFWIQDGGFPDLLAKYLGRMGRKGATYLGGIQIVNAFRALLNENPTQHVMPWFAQGVDAGNGILSLKRPWWYFGMRRLHLEWNARQSPVFDAIVNMHKRLSEITGGEPIVPLTWTLGRNLITPHPLGGCNMATNVSRGVVDHRGRVFEYPNLYVADGAIIPRALGVNPSRTIAALAERIAEILINEGR